MDSDLRLLTIVGIVGDTHEYGLDVPPHPTVYVNLFQRPRAAITVTMLSDADTRMVTSAALGILRELNSEIPARFRTLSQVYSSSLGSRRFNVILVGFFACRAFLPQRFAVRPAQTLRIKAVAVMQPQEFLQRLPHAQEGRLRRRTAQPRG